MRQRRVSTIRLSLGVLSVFENFCEENKIEKYENYGEKFSLTVKPHKIKDFVDKLEFIDNRKIHLMFKVTFVSPRAEEKYIDGYV